MAMKVVSYQGLLKPLRASEGAKAPVCHIDRPDHSCALGPNESSVDVVQDCVQVAAVVRCKAAGR